MQRFRDGVQLIGRLDKVGVADVCVLPKVGAIGLTLRGLPAFSSLDGGDPRLNTLAITIESSSNHLLLGHAFSHIRITDGGGPAGPPP